MNTKKETFDINEIYNDGMQKRKWSKYIIAKYN